MNDIKPLTASMGQAETPVKVFFFERPDGSTIHVDEEAAWSLYARPQQTTTGRNTFKYIGCTDGIEYYKAVQEAGLIFKEQGLEAAQDHLRKAMEAEKAKAPLNRTLPRNFDTVDKNGQPVDTRTL